MGIPELLARAAGQYKPRRFALDCLSCIPLFITITSIGIISDASTPSIPPLSLQSVALPTHPLPSSNTRDHDERAGGMSAFEA